MLLSEVFALSLERSEADDDRALIEERSNDSANTSLSGTLERAVGLQRVKEFAPTARRWCL